MSAQVSPRPEDHNMSVARQPRARATAQVLVHPENEAAMHPHVYRIALLCWSCFLAVFWVTFWTSSNALFQVVIGTVYAVMFFGVPYEMSRIYTGKGGKRTSDKTLWQFLEQPFRTRTGVMKGYEALIQVILVPVLLTLGGTAIGIIIRSARAGL